MDQELNLKEYLQFGSGEGVRVREKWDQSLDDKHSVRESVLIFTPN